MNNALKSISDSSEPAPRSFSENVPRLKPVENPKSLKLKLAYWFSKLFFGKVLTPMKVHYARFPEGLGLSKKLAGTEEKFTIDPKLNHLIKTYVATINGCGFCIDIGKASAQKKELEPHIFDECSPEYWLGRAM